jgi:hypothetical protein
LGKLALLLIAVALPLAVTAMAAANSTQSQVVTEHQTDPFVAATNACGFPIDLRTDGSFEITHYYDNSGTLFKENVHNTGGPFTVTAVNPANGKSTTTESESEVIIRMFNPDGSLASERVTGVVYSFVVSGLGTILQGVGRLVFDGDGNLAFEAGPHDFRDHNTEAFCSYMADP